MPSSSAARNRPDRRPAWRRRCRSARSPGPACRPARMLSGTPSPSRRRSAAAWRRTITLTATPGSRCVSAASQARRIGAFGAAGARAGSTMPVPSTTMSSRACLVDRRRDVRQCRNRRRHRGGRDTRRRRPRRRRTPAPSDSDHQARCIERVSCLASREVRVGRPLRAPGPRPSMSLYHEIRAGRCNHYGDA